MKTPDQSELFQQVYVATTTYSNGIGELRTQLALRTIKDLVALTGHPPIVVDASPDLASVAAFEEAGAYIVLQNPNTRMGQSRRQAVRYAMDDGAKIVIWMEPEKYPMVPFLPNLVAPILSDEFDIIIPRRRTLRSYPEHQMLRELQGNHEAGSMTGRPDLDLWVGVRVMNIKAAGLFLNYDGECGDRWESIFIPVVMALREGLRVGSVDVDYVHPPEQTKAETGDPEFDRKRDVQLEVLLASINMAITTPWR